jgi:glycosyltransferase involved in cell wall biosynthesis
MRSLPEILKERPQAQVFIIGGDGVSYGHAPPEGETWKEIYLQEVSDKIDLSRVHFLGQVAYPIYLALLQISTVHVYLTYPFVLSWSCIEAMSVGCAIVGSDTPPVREVITHNETGRLVNFLSPSEISSQVIDLIENPSERQRLGFNARQYALEHYDRNSVCLPQQIDWVEKIFI